MKYDQIINDNLLWEERYNFVSCLNKFITEDWDLEEFSDALDIIVLKTWSRDNFKIENFEPDPRRKGFSRVISQIRMDYELFDTKAEEGEPFSQQWLKDCAKETLSEIQKYL